MNRIQTRMFRGEHNLVLDDVPRGDAVLESVAVKCLVADGRRWWVRVAGDGLAALGNLTPPIGVETTGPVALIQGGLHARTEMELAVGLACNTDLLLDIVCDGSPVLVQDPKSRSLALPI
jgi:hypothetical protein